MLGFASFLSLALEEHGNGHLFHFISPESFIVQPASLNGVARSQSAGTGSFTSALVLGDCSLPVLEKQEVVRQEAGTGDNNHLCSG